MVWVDCNIVSVVFCLSCVLGTFLNKWYHSRVPYSEFRNMAAMSNTSTMICLSASNYSIWKSKMEDILYCKDLYDLVLGDTTKPTTMSNGGWKKLCRKTIGTIRQWIDDSVFHHVAQETEAHTLWKKLETLYERKNAQSKAFTIRKLVNLKYRDGGSVAKHLSILSIRLHQQVLRLKMSCKLCFF